jgi:DNA replication protein DnaC
MSGTPTIDTARLPMLLTQLRLPTVARLWRALTDTADRESWPAAKTLAALMEHEIAERARRRTARHLLEARLPAGKTLDCFDFTAVTSISKARVTALAEGDSWLDQGTNILLFGPPGVGKSHLAAALGHAMVDAGYRVLFTRTTDLVQQLQTARQELKLAAAIEKLDKYHLLVLDDLSYVQKSQAETSVIFELISARYERRSLLITANQPFGAWDAIFPDPTMTVAAIDRLVHHSIILEMNADSYRRKSAETKLRRKPTGPAVKTAPSEPSSTAGVS